MKRIQIFGFYLLFLCLYAEGQSNSYVYLHDNCYSVAQCISEVSQLDDDVLYSAVTLLKKYIEDGNTVGLRDEVMQVLEYAQWLLEQERTTVDNTKRIDLLLDINNITYAIEQDLLTVNKDDAGQKTLVPFIVHDIRVDDNREDGSVVRLNVDTNITMNDSISKEIGNIIKETSTGPVRFIHNYNRDQGNTFVGLRAGNFSMGDAAINNTAIGTDALRFNTSGNHNTAIGKSALRNNRTGTGGVAIGYNALGSVQSHLIDDVAIGDSALSNISEVGLQIVFGRNTAIGRSALRGVLRGRDNVGIGALVGTQAIGYRGAQSENVLIGNQAGNVNPQSGFIRRNVYVGHGAGTLVNGGYFYNINIGHPGVLQQDGYTTRLGQQQTQCFIAGINSTRAPSSSLATGFVPVFIDADGKLGTMQSSRNVKHAIKQIDDESECIYNLNPVSFVYKNDETATQHYGLVAEEVYEHCPSLVVKDNNDIPYVVRYEMLPILLLNEMKKQECVMNKNNHDMQQQRDDLKNMRCVLNDLQNKVQQFIAVRI